MSAITIDFEKTMRQAAQLDSCADKLRRMTANEYARSMQTLANAWKSDSASAFFGKGELLHRNINNTANDLEVIANNLRRAARRIYEAEKKAEEIAKQRAAKG
ncbi:MAG: hypothetical protein E7578_00440 [Ruminococcaceae bacterium]|nr:hypothetical protein [Oscillospiraceae bacterium]